MSVFPFTLRDDKLKFENSIANETAVVVLKGVDGVYADYAISTYQSLTLLGSKSNWPIDLTIVATSDVTAPTEEASAIMISMVIIV